MRLMKYISSKFILFNFNFTIKFHLLYSCLAVYFCAQTIQAQTSLPFLEESHANSAPTPELIRLNGYRCDIHFVLTVDGYILQVHRLPGGRVKPINCSLPPVLMVHGILSSSVAWILAGPDQGLAYLLADLGYDVWLGNVRGNVYGRFNVHYSVDEDSFWDFSWETAGQFDLSATIDYILNTTGHDKLLFVGHSMGITEFLVLCTLRPEYNKKIQYVVALAPVANLTYSTSIVRYLAPFADAIVPIVKSSGHGEVGGRNTEMTNFLQRQCALKTNEFFCETLLFLFFGFDYIGFNQTLIPTIFGHTPAGTSVKTILHYAQVINARAFQRYDYGTEKNLELYQSASPPKFNLSAISVPLSIFYGDKDALADPKDVMDLVTQLKVKVDVYRVNLTTFNHIDFVAAKNVKILLNNKVITILKAKQTLSKASSCGL